MTKFVKESFEFDGMYLMYNLGTERKFVARFKYAKDGKGSFLTFLIKNFTVEEYFAARAENKAPLEILEAKGYVQPHVKKLLKQQGYTPDAAGKKAYLRDQVIKTYKSLGKPLPADFETA